MEHSPTCSRSSLLAAPQEGEAEATGMVTHSAASAIGESSRSAHGILTGGTSLLEDDPLCALMSRCVDTGDSDMSAHLSFVAAMPQDEDDETPMFSVGVSSASAHRTLVVLGLATSMGKLTAQAAIFL